MLKIRLARVGKKKKPTYRFVVSEQSRDLYGNHLEILGHYNPFTKVCEVKKDRILYWMSVGAKPSPTAHNLLVDQNVITGPKINLTRSKKSAEGGSLPAGQAGASGGKGAEAPAPTAKPAEATTPVEAPAKIEDAAKPEAAAPTTEAKAEEKK